MSDAMVLITFDFQYIIAVCTKNVLFPEIHAGILPSRLNKIFSIFLSLFTFA